MNCNVIHVYRKPALDHLLVEYCVHHHLECGRGVDKAKEHHNGFEEAFWYKKGSLPFVPWLNLNVIIPLTDVEFGKQGAATEAIDGLGN
jgi:hypothetical protein